MDLYRHDYFVPQFFLLVRVGLALSLEFWGHFVRQFATFQLRRSIQ